ncbi:MAG: peptide chain release factor 2, partial [Angelakisella sp.]
MLQFEELKLRLSGLSAPLRDLRAALNIEGGEKEAAELELKTGEPGFWDDPERSKLVLQKQGVVKNKL